MRILHLGYEDYVQPGSGGGSIRTREINRRISSRHEITVLVAGYPGAKPRLEDGIRWLPLGPRSGKKIDRLAYFALLGTAIRRIPHDLVVEDFSAPFSIGFSPWFTDKPVVASVQWLFASQMSAKYHLPFDLVEKRGLSLYMNFISVSNWLAERIRERRPGAQVTSIPNGIDCEAFSIKSSKSRHLLFVGRLDIQQKGCDLLVEIASRVSRLLGDRMPPLLIVGNGPDRLHLEAQIQKAGMTEKVKLLGRIEGMEKYRLMANAFAVLMPSRFETFGMVAVESQAASTPVVTFDIGPMREVAGGGGACLVPPFDLEAFAQATASIVMDEGKRIHLGDTGRRWAQKYDWETIAREQEAIYLEAVSAG